MPWRGPSYEGEFPTLGFEVLDFMAAELIVPDGPLAGEPLIATEEQAAFTLRLYRVNPRAEGALIRGRFRNWREVHRAVLSRSKGWGKSPFMAGLCIAEALGPVVPDGWDDMGEPVGRPWTSLGFKALVQIMATSEGQTDNTWLPLLEMCREGPVGVDYDIEPLESFVNVPNGRIQPATSAARSREGFRPVFNHFDQTESWTPSIGGPKLAATARRNLTKVGGCSVETPNAFNPGEGSVAEASSEAARLQLEGRLKIDTGILYDHREAPADTDMGDYDSLIAGLEVAYGDSVGFVDLDRIVALIWDPDSDPSDSRRFWLNQSEGAANSWLTRQEVFACDAPMDAERRDVITLGFDGSRSRRRGVTDATALVATRVLDGLQWDIGIWEEPPDWKLSHQGEPWAVPMEEVDKTVDSAFSTYEVVGFFGDPEKWETYVAKWEAKYGARLKVKAMRDHPIEFWMKSRPTVSSRMLEHYHSAIVDHEVKLAGSKTFRAHLLNARRRPSKSGLLIAKEHPDSMNKIDGTIAGALSWEARLEAVAMGLGARRKHRVVGQVR